MKELTIEEKAERYEKALSVAQETYTTQPTYKDWLAKMFPELKESEDEKIRRALISFHKSTIDIDGIKGDDILTWLEKQGEYKPTDKYNIRGIKSKHAEGKLGEMIKNLKFSDKVEPKFHEGDWVVDKDGHIFKIMRVDNDFNHITYACRPIEENSRDWASYSENDIRLWDITEDAKAGDVLVDGNLPFIFKKIDTNKYIYAYCGISVDDGFKIESDGESGEWTWMQDIKPATEEQRDVLFAKMREAGYEWDAEKKELKKVEVEELTAFEEAVKDMMDDYRDAIDDNKATTEEVKERAAYMLSLIPQKPAEWSDEDERILRTIISDGIRGAEIDMLQINWLKAIKKRVACEAKCTTKKEWSKEVEIWIDRACMLLDELNHLSTLTLAKIPSNVNDIISHLKSLKDRIGG